MTCGCGNPLHHPPGRRGLLAAGLACAALAPLSPARAAGPRTSLTPDQALALMRQGNRDFVSDVPPPSGPTMRERRLELAASQTPFCVLVGCSDSRVSPELLFRRSLGELFIVRVAGNTVDLTGLGSIEYGVGELGVPLIVVLGHERCGAVAAAVSVVRENAIFPGSIGPMVEPIVPAVLAARAAGGTEEELLDRAVRENARRVAARLPRASAVLKEAVEAGRLKVVGAYYDLDDGEVEFFG